MAMVPSGSLGGPGHYRKLGGGSSNSTVVTYYHPSVPIFANKVYEGFYYPGVVLCNLGQH